MTLFCSSTFLESTITGILANIIFTLGIIYIVQKIRYWYYLRLNFHKKHFNAFWKHNKNDVVYSVHCTVIGRRILFKSTKVKGTDEFEGEFIMNPVRLKYGEGFHTHLQSDGFGFSKIVIREKQFYIEMPYFGYFIDPNGTTVGKQHYQAFIWRINDINDDKTNE